MAQAQADDAFAPEALLVGGFGDPARFRFQVHIAAEDVLVRELGRGGEVAEVQLADGAFQAQAQLVVGHGRPGGQDARLGEEEALFLSGVAGLADGGGLQPQAAFQRPLGIDPPGGLAKQFTARLLDLDRGRGQGHGHAADRIGLLDLQHIVGHLGAALEVHGRRAFIAHQTAQDGLGRIAVGAELLLGLVDGAQARVRGREVIEVAKLVDEAGLQLQLFGQGAGVDDAELTTVAVFVIETLAQDIGTGAAVDVVPVVDSVARRQVDLAAHEGIGEVAPDRVPAAVAVIEELFVAQHGAVGVDAHNRAHAVGIAG
ncbi:hypothetical protein D3C72_818410 [compost metagenome]